MTCANPKCGKKFTPHRWMQKYCCIKCRRDTIAKRYYDKNLASSHSKELQCNECGNLFIVNQYGGHAKFCSDTCHNKAMYRRHKDKIVKRANDWISANRERLNKSHREYRSKNRSKVSVWEKKWTDANKSKVNKSALRRIADLSDGYVRAKIKQQFGVPIYSDKMIELKRNYIKLKRKIYGKESKNSSRP